MNEKPVIIQASYDLLKDTIKIVNKFPRSQKFTLGDRLQNHLSDLMELYLRAYYSKNIQKKALLEEANIQLEILRHYYRIAYDFGFYNSLKYQHFASILQEIGRMTGGWIKSLEKINRPPPAENKSVKK